MSQAGAWGLLILSGFLDVAWAVSVKQAAGYSRVGWSLTSFVLLGLFIFALGRALQLLPLGMAYAVWTGIGAIGSVVAGILFFGEAVDTARLAWIAITLVGMIGLKLTSR
ncbi:DMT family transporter [Novosphingobium terrae]|uniref:DMT family transporter n=1 Tax=Novosphingobium terrae TaxID=2726189 RepID=UPI00197E1F49|nr:multidrug efflux SMR transporter [Novosphingobium terrae]